MLYGAILCFLHLPLGLAFNFHIKCILGPSSFWLIALSCKSRSHTWVGIKFNKSRLICERKKIAHE